MRTTTTRVSAALLVLCSALSLSACDASLDPTKPPADTVPDVAQSTQGEVLFDDPRFEIVRQGSFWGCDSRNGSACKKSVLLLKDKQTGAEFIGITGVGLQKL